MSTYRTGNHWGVTIVREGDIPCPGVPPQAELVAVVVNGDQALAERICELLNAPTPDVPYTHGARESLAEVRRRLGEDTDPAEARTVGRIRRILEHAAAELGVDEDAPSARPISPLAAEQGAGVTALGADVRKAAESLCDGTCREHPGANCPEATP